MKIRIFMGNMTPTRFPPTMDRYRPLKVATNQVRTTYIIRNHVIVKMVIKGRKRRKLQSKGGVTFTKQRKDKQ